MLSDILFYLLYQQNKKKKNQKRGKINSRLQMIPFFFCWFTEFTCLVEAQLGELPKDCFFVCLFFFNVDAYLMQDY